MLEAIGCLANRASSYKIVRFSWCPVWAYRARLYDVVCGLLVLLHLQFDVEAGNEPFVHERIKAFNTSFLAIKLSPSCSEQTHSMC